MPTIKNGIANSPFKKGDLASSQWTITNIKETNGINIYPSPHNMPASKARNRSMVP